MSPSPPGSAVSRRSGPPSRAGSPASTSQPSNGSSASTRRCSPPDDEERIMATTKRFDLKDPALAPEGVRRIEWADRQMPVLAAIRERFEREQPLAGYRISAC